MPSPGPDPNPPPTPRDQQWDVGSARAGHDAFMGSSVNIYNYGAQGATQPPGAPPAHQPWMVPYAPNPQFAGRADELARLHEGLAAGPGAAVAVTGMAGQGKTQLAAEYAHRQRAAYPGGVFWLNMEQLEGVAGQVAACAGPKGLAL